MMVTSLATLVSSACSATRLALARTSFSSRGRKLQLLPQQLDEQLLTFPCVVQVHFWNVVFEDGEDGDLASTKCPNMYMAVIFDTNLCIHIYFSLFQWRLNFEIQIHRLLGRALKVLAMGSKLHHPWVGGSTTISEFAKFRLILLNKHGPRLSDF
jgi:hypothetical protein